ncbi:uncharacterized protein LOC118449119 [Vespa mandarinia]|uniref:uncharacterized protein LOC118449119 n=1 Tax=Vespa mandarinia TaxID=7446 RepID=UPI00162270EC|nr:uncharacterized protein LOC118449119 [Vespa mandarinia]
MSFRPHFEALIPKVEGILQSLRRLLILHGLGEKKQRLYSGVIHSVLLYGAPVWWCAVVEDMRIEWAVRTIQRKVVIWLCCAYRAVSFYAAMNAGIIPLVHLASRLAEIYAAVRDAEDPVPRVVRLYWGLLPDGEQ